MSFDWSRDDRKNATVLHFVDDAHLAEKSDARMHHDQPKLIEIALLFDSLCVIGSEAHGLQVISALNADSQSAATFKNHFGAVYDRDGTETVTIADIASERIAWVVVGKTHW